MCRWDIILPSWYSLHATRNMDTSIWTHFFCRFWDVHRLPSTKLIHMPSYYMLWSVHVYTMFILRTLSVALVNVHRLTAVIWHTLAILWYVIWQYVHGTPGDGVYTPSPRHVIINMMYSNDSWMNPLFIKISQNLYSGDVRIWRVWYSSYLCEGVTSV